MQWTSNDPSAMFPAGPSLSYSRKALKRFWKIQTTKTPSRKSVVIELNVLLWYTVVYNEDRAGIFHDDMEYHDDDGPPNRQNVSRE